MNRPVSKFETQIWALEEIGYEVKHAPAFDDIEAVNRQQTTLVTGEFALEREPLVEDQRDG